MYLRVMSLILYDDNDDQNPLSVAGTQWDSSIRLESPETYMKPFRILEF